MDFPTKSSSGTNLGIPIGVFAFLIFVERLWKYFFFLQSLLMWNVDFGFKFCTEFSFMFVLKNMAMNVFRFSLPIGIYPPNPLIFPHKHTQTSGTVRFVEARYGWQIVEFQRSTDRQFQWIYHTQIGYIFRWFTENNVECFSAVQYCKMHSLYSCKMCMGVF